MSTTDGVDPDREFFVSLVNAIATNMTNATNTTAPPTTMSPIDLGLTYHYVCEENTAEAKACPVNCTSLDGCLACECHIAYLEDTGGPWGQVGDFFLCMLPIFYLVFATVKPNPTPTTRSLPTSAVIMFLVRTMYLGSNPLMVCGSVVLGIHEALTPLTIMAGAITLFETMEATKCLPFMMREMKALTGGHPVATVMLLFGFATLVEGASGFGTPVALGAPMLVSTGNPPLESVVIMLLFNTFATVWGAVGTPLWFGFGELGLSEDDYIEISYRAAVAMIFSAFILIPFILTILVPFRLVKRNIIFLLLSIATVMGPVLGLSFFTYEFPSLMGGLIGCALTGILIRFKVGLADMEEEDEEQATGSKTGTDTPIVVDDLMEITDISRGYHKAISDLTEAKAPKMGASTTGTVSSPPALSGNEDDDNEPTAIQMSNTEVTAEDENGDETKEAMAKKSTTSVSTGQWDNVEVQQDAVNTDDATSTVVIMSPEKTADKDPESDGVAAAEQPPLVEEDLKKSQLSESKPLTKSQLLAQSATAREDALLGPRKSFKEGYLFEVLLRTFPIWGVVVLLILTRVSSIGIKQYLTKMSPHWEVQFGTYGDFRLSVSLVFQLRHILTYPGLNWKYELLYIPFLIPFVLVSLLTMGLYRKDLTCRPRDIAATVVGRLSSPAVALMGALILVQLLIKQDAEAPAFILGTTLADWLKQGFIVISPILGALGSFFSGSTTVSNLTFGEIQQIAATDIGTSVNTMLALQAVGASAGNGICLNNIIAALAVVGLNVSEGQILMRTAKYVFCSTTIATVVMLAFFFRF